MEVNTLKCKDCLYFLGRMSYGTCEIKPTRMSVQKTAAACKQFVPRDATSLQPSMDTLWHIACGTCRNYTTLPGKVCRDCKLEKKGGWIQREHT